MKRFAVAYVDEDNSLSIELIESENWRDALMKHSTLINACGDELHDELQQLPDDLEDAKEEATVFLDFEFDVKEI